MLGRDGKLDVEFFSEKRQKLEKCFGFWWNFFYYFREKFLVDVWRALRLIFTMELFTNYVINKCLCWYGGEVLDGSYGIFF